MEKFKAHILVVDDDDRIRDLVKQYLNENNYLVTTAISAEDAQKKVEIIKFDLIVLDIMMPGKSGLEFTTDNKNKLYNLVRNGPFNHPGAKSIKRQTYSFFITLICGNTMS